MFDDLPEEAFLHFLWKQKALLPQKLFTKNKEQILIDHWGTLNHNAGPDFLHAKIKIGASYWQGHIEMHVKSSDWFNHGHHRDKAYNPVVLHVVYVDDKKIYRQDGTTIPTLVLNQIVNPSMYYRYKTLQSNLDGIPCESLLSKIDHIPIWKKWKEELMVKRLGVKCSGLKLEFEKCSYDWEELCYRLTAKYLGQKVNRTAFEVLTERTPLKILQRQRNHPNAVEAILFGQAGMLGTKDAYEKKLMVLYNHYKLLYRLEPLEKATWKFSRMRPANFPSIRIAQLAELVRGQRIGFRRILEIESKEEMDELLSVSAPSYWQKHSFFGRRAKMGSGKIGRQALEILYINVIAPLLFYYGHITGKQRIMEKAISLLVEIPAEKNLIIKKWKSIGVKATSALESQALIHLRRNYCEQKKCLECEVGGYLLTRSKHQNNVDLLSNDKK